jgi:hypothetical protein
MTSPKNSGMHGPAGLGAQPASDRGRRALRVAAALHALLGLGFGVGSAPVLVYFARNGELPMSPFGWRYMSGPAEQLGPVPFMALGWTLVAVCVLDVVAGRWLWQGRRRGLRSGVATNSFAFALGLGFALPLLIVGVPLRAVLAWAGRGGLDR